MSKRHQSSRRKSYGRRQHELRERADRQHLPDPGDGSWDADPDTRSADRFAFLDPGSARLRFALGD